MINKIQIHDIANEIISDFKSHYLNSNGLISLTYPPTDRLIFDHFDDIAPFFIYFGEEEFLLNQVRILKEYKYETILKRNDLIYSYLIDEYLGGLYILWKQTRSNIVKEQLDIAVDKTINLFIYENDLYMVYDIYQNKIIKQRSYRSAGILETFLEMSSDYPRLGELATSISEKWMDSKYFHKYGLFPYKEKTESRDRLYRKLIPNLKPLLFHQIQIIRSDSTIKTIAKKIVNFYYYHIQSDNYTFLFKDNSTFIFTLIELYRKTSDIRYKDLIEKWIESVKNLLIDDNVLYGQFLAPKKKWDTSVNHTFIYIDILIDYYCFIEKKESYLDLVKKLIDKRVVLDNGEAFVLTKLRSSIMRIDNSIDLAISIRRYGEVVNSKYYTDISVNIILTTLKYHKTNIGFCTLIDKKYLTDAKINNKSKIIDPKYNGLLLKALICLLTVDKSIYESKELHDLFKDR